MEDIVKFWETGDTRIHPDTECPYSGFSLLEITDGKAVYIYCSDCDKTWRLNE